MKIIFYYYNSTGTAVMPTMPMYSTLFGKQYRNSAMNTDCNASTSALSNFTKEDYQNG